jgi:hypothetical protein
MTEKQLAGLASFDGSASRWVELDSLRVVFVLDRCRGAGKAFRKWY